jgi:peptide chain release factor 3
MRNTPVIIFVNKMDREGKDAFDLLDELEEKLSIKTRPLSWPIGIGDTFKGVYNLFDNTLKLFNPNKVKIETESIEITDLDDDTIEQYVGKSAADKLRSDIELVEGVYGDFDENQYAEGHVAPVFFGSALNNFGVQELLDTFVRIAPSPRPRKTTLRMVEPDEKKFSGFVFKIHANLDPKHRDRIAFLRVCSGKFERNTFYHHVRLNKNIRFSNPSAFMAQSKSVIDEAWPGDVVGLYDTGNFKIGDTLTEGDQFYFEGIPSFSPEIFRELVNQDPLKSKQLEKGIRQLTDEGVAQLFIHPFGNKKIVGTVGELQFDVIKYRLEHEYTAKCSFTPLSYFKACWVTSDNDSKLKEFIRLKANYMVEDKDGLPVFLAPSAWILKVEQQDNPDIKFKFTSEILRFENA